MTDDETRALTRDLHAAYARGDGARVAELFDEDIDWEIYGPAKVFSFAGKRRGKKEVLETLEALSKEFSAERYEPTVVLADGNRSAVMSDTTFRQTRTGRILSFRIADFMVFRNGRIVEFREFWDTFDVTEQALGTSLVV